MTLTPEQPAPLPWRSLAASLAVFSALSLTCAIASPGFLDADALTHYLYARFALSEPHYLADVWGRPVCTALYALPAYVAGRLGVRLTSLVLACATALLTFDIARRQKLPRPELAALFVLAQPLLFLHSFSELTEIPFAFLTAVGFWAYQQRRWHMMALVAGLMPAARPEGFALLLLAALALVLHRRALWLPIFLGVAGAIAGGLLLSGQSDYLPVMLAVTLTLLLVLSAVFRSLWLPLLLLPWAIWSMGGWYTYGGSWHGQWSTFVGPWEQSKFMGVALWLPQHWPYTAASAYQKGPLLHFLALMPVVVSPLILPATLIGAWRALRNGPSGVLQSLRGDDHLLRCRRLIALLPLGVLLGHSILYWRGWLASNGELRYLLVVAPLWALLGNIGWAALANAMAWRAPVRIAAIAALVPLLVNLIHPVAPVAPSFDWPQAEVAARWHAASPLLERYPRLMTSHRAVNYLRDVSMSDRERAWQFSEDAIRHPPPGTILIWDPVHGRRNANRALTADVEEIRQAGWIPLTTVPPQKTAARFRLRWLGKLERRYTSEAPGDWHIFVSPTDRHGRPFAAGDKPLPPSGL